MTKPNHRLRRLREHDARLSRQDLADQANAYLWSTFSERVELDANYIGKLERGVIAWPRPRYREALRAVLRASSDAELGLLNTRRVVREPGPAVVEEVSEWHVQEVLGAADLLHRRHHLHGGWSMRSAALAQLDSATRLLRTDVPRTVLRPLRGAVAHLAHTCGFMHFDTGDHDEARRCLRYALHLADLAGDRQSRAFVLSSLSRLATWTGRHGDGLAHAEQALLRPDGLTAVELAMVHAARAKALAALGRVDEAIGELKTADDRFARADPTTAPPWMAFYGLAQHCGDTAEAFAHLDAHGHRSGEVRARFAVAHRDQGPAYSRSRALAHTRFAAAVLAEGDPVEGALLGQAAVAAAGGLRSARLDDTLRALHRQAARHGDVREARELRDQVEHRVGCPGS